MGWGRGRNARGVASVRWSSERGDGGWADEREGEGGGWVRGVGARARRTYLVEVGCEVMPCPVQPPPIHPWQDACRDRKTVFVGAVRLLD